MDIKFQDYIANTREVKEIGNAYSYVFGYLENQCEQLLSNLFIGTADSNTLGRWEKFLGIEVSPDAELESRRMNILLLLNRVVPYTFRTIEQQIKSIAGNNSSIHMDYKKNKLTVNLQGVFAYKRKLVEIFLKSVLPCSVYFEIVSISDIKNEHTFYQVVSRVIRREI